MTSTKTSKSKPIKLKQNPAKQLNQETNPKLTPLSSYKTTTTSSNTNNNANENTTTPPTSPQSVQSANTTNTSPSSPSSHSSSTSSPADPKPIFTNTTSHSNKKIQPQPPANPHPIKSQFQLRYPSSNLIFTPTRNEIKGELTIVLLQDLPNVTGIDMGFSGDVVIRCSEYRFTSATPGTGVLASQSVMFDTVRQVAFVEEAVFDSWKEEEGVVGDKLVFERVRGDGGDGEDEVDGVRNVETDGETTKGDEVEKGKVDQESVGDGSGTSLGDVELLEKMKDYDGFKSVDVDHHEGHSEVDEKNTNTNYDYINTPTTIVNEIEDPLGQSTATETNTKSTIIDSNEIYYTDTHKPDIENENENENDKDNQTPPVAVACPWEKTKHGVTFKKGTVLKYPFQFNIQSMNGGELPTSCRAFGEKSGETGLTLIAVM
ncbi:unnamed protein product [Ambrosiozyma monospora]|uniref:Unnamed protein product n=1 Tax=Ambrosiozyma monospora TaxID=43982 RepID=A0ACB5T570_AMBMO|nr:unnamed protein product [Ambrosiozyma monospora]